MLSSENFDKNFASGMLSLENFDKNLETSNALEFAIHNSDQLFIMQNELYEEWRRDGERNGRGTGRHSRISNVSGCVIDNILNSLDFQECVYFRFFNSSYTFRKNCKEELFIQSSLRSVLPIILGLEPSVCGPLVLMHCKHNKTSF